MRRKDREVIDPNQILSILQSIKVVRLAMIDGSIPYILPLNFGFTFNDDQLILYFHSAISGKKITLLETNPQVGFEMDGGHHLITGDTACDYSFDFVSIIGDGQIEFINSSKDKKTALNLLMKHQSGLNDFDYPEVELNAVKIYRLKVTNYCVKQHTSVKQQSQSI